jgi:hypothetical protein
MPQFASQQAVLLAAIAAYLYFGFFLMVLARRTSTSLSWLAWIPIANLFQMCRIGRRSLFFGVLLLMPLLNLLIAALVWMSIAKARGKPGWTGALILVPGVNLLLLPYLAWGPATDPDAVAAPPPVSAAPLERPAHCPNCGVAANPDERFCGECGTDLDAAAEPASVPATAPVAPKEVRRSTAASVAIIATAAVVIGGVYIFWNYGGRASGKRDTPAMPPVIAGTMTEFPIDTEPMHPLMPDAVVTQQVTGGNLRVPVAWLPPGTGPAIAQRARAITATTYRTHSPDPPVTVAVLSTAAGQSGDAAREIASAVTKANGATESLIEVKSPLGQVYEGVRLKTDTQSTYVLARDEPPNVVIVHAQTARQAPDAARLAQNVGNGAGLGAFPALQSSLWTLPSRVPAGLELQEARTLPASELTAIDAQAGDAARQLGPEAQQWAGRLTRMLPDQLVMARYQDANKQNWGIIRGEYTAAGRAMTIWTMLRGFMTMTSTEALPIKNTTGRITDFDRQRVLIFRSAASLVLTLAPSGTPSDQIRQLAEGIQ